jgi:ribosomal protein S18 acetylase RimI-like enzyme
VIAFAGPNAYGAAWYRLFPASAAGFGFVDEQTPELTIAVVPSCRGKGYGEELLEALLAQAKRDGFEQVSLSVEPDNPALRLYERHGFHKVGESGGSWTMNAADGTADIRLRPGNYTVESDEPFAFQGKGFAARGRCKAASSLCRNA